MSITAFIIVCIVVWFAFVKGRSVGKNNCASWEEYIDSVKTGVYFRGPGFCGYNEFGLLELASLSAHKIKVLIDSYIEHNPYNQKIADLQNVRWDVFRAIMMDRYAAVAILLPIGLRSMSGGLRDQFEEYRKEHNMFSSFTNISPEEWMKMTEKERRESGAYHKLDVYVSSR